MTQQVVTVTPDMTIGAALRLLALRDVGRLPVVDKRDSRRLVGLIRRTDIARAYQLGILRREDLQDRAEQIRSSQRWGDAEFVELVVQPGSAAAGKRVRELALPTECLLTTRRQRNRMHILHGDDLLEAGDVVLALCEPSQVYELRKLFQ
jgi:NhaP-type Na+/H+ and K+/H+ antiporter